MAQRGPAATLPALQVEMVEWVARDDMSAVESLAPSHVRFAFALTERWADATQQMMGWLSSEEEERLRRFRFERDRRLYLVAHALLRWTLSRCSGVDPADWQFQTGRHGRPEIASPPVPLRFSLSHTRGLAVCAVTLEHDIGVDVEEIVADRTTSAIDRLFTSEEVADLRSLSGERRTIRFFEYWTLKEAYLKARGLGLSLPLDSFSLRRDADERWRIAFEQAQDDDPARWALWSRRLTDEHQAALAVSM